MLGKNIFWVGMFGIILVIISAYGIILTLLLSNILNLKMNFLILLACMVPFLLGIGIIKLNNIFRLLTLSLSIIMIIIVPLIHYSFVKLFYANPSLKLAFDFSWLTMELFCIFTIFYLNHPQVRKQFKPIGANFLKRG